MELPGQYVSNGATVTYYQPPESLGPITTVPYTVAIPKSSNCVTYQSTDLYAAASTTAAASSAATATATGTVASQHASSGAASHSASRSGSASTSTSTANASLRNTQTVSAWPAALMAGLVGFGGLLGVVAAL
ncbi:hypothetical protein BN14_06403 [Rhizoctonia solani AG-1 IB]|uniref:Uncharacterized protein n=1 Tax=Thanatephorus cucumeris (strain AG1-IB / isolate 7/3/14) TaxID=1108050 RepID=M5BYN5_THACB|nr:hypothetical protein BN14_06403 [Rhizoctonia solani AG-1 IB]